VAQAREYQAAGHFHKGSMGPKVEACISFLERGGQSAVISNPENLGRALAGETGTWLVP
jgi:carbamate kinase